MTLVAHRLVRLYLECEGLAGHEEFAAAFTEYITALLHETPLQSAYVYLPDTGAVLYAERATTHTHVALYRGWCSRAACRAWAAVRDTGLLGQPAEVCVVDLVAQLLAELFAPVSGVAWSKLDAPAIRASRQRLALAIPWPVDFMYPPRGPPAVRVVGS